MPDHIPNLPIPQPKFDSRVRASEINGQKVYSMVDIMAIYYDNKDRAAGHWRDAKRRLKKEMGQLWQDFPQLKLTAADGKNYLTDVGTRRDILRVFMTEKSERSEPFRQWLLDIAQERMRDIGWDASEIHARLDEAGLLGTGDFIIDLDKSRFWWLD